MTRNSEKLPFVSVIIPVFNDAERVVMCIHHLLGQSYPQDRYEIIVVDNSSTDETYQSVARMPVTLLSENSKQSSYAARNIGILHARGDIIAFTDSDCKPVEAWIASGVKALVQQKCDLIGGNVRYEFSHKKTGAEIFDSLTNMQIENNVKIRKVGKTANLFATKSVFEEIGLFDDRLKSGGDVSWTQTATQAGFKIGYSSRAEIIHPARRLIPLIKKQFRVGKGQFSIWRKNDGFYSKVFFKLLLCLKPPFVFLYKNELKNELNLTFWARAHVFMAAWICRFSTGVGIVCACWQNHKLE